MATAAAAQKTASTHRTAVLRGAHQLDILGYTTRRRLCGADNTVRSRSFDVGGFHWTLVCRFQEPLTKLRGVTLASIALELSQNETDEAVVATASIRIDDPKGTGLWPAAEWCSKDPNVFPARSSTPVVWELAVPETFRDHEARYVDTDADRLTIHCSVDVFREESTEGAATRSCQLVSVLPPSSLCKDIHRLREEMWWPDVTFVVGEAKIQAHKLVLAMRSPVFAAEFHGGMKEKTMRHITIHDMTDIYDLERLRLMCENILSESINIGNVMATLMLVHNRSSCHLLETSCVEYMASNPDVYEAVEAREEYKELDKTCPSFINDITKKVAKRAVARNRSSSSSSSSSSITKSTSKYDPSAVMTGTHEFKIESFSAVRKTHGLKKYITSGGFKVGGYEWAIRVYPSGDRQDFKEHIAIFLMLLNPPPRDLHVKTTAWFGITGPSGKSMVHKLRHDYTQASSGQGFADVVKISSANSKFVGRDGSFTVSCRVDITTESCSSNTIIAASAIPVPVSPSNMSWHLEQLLACEDGWDVRFLVEEDEVHAHGLVIATRSPALHEMVESATRTDHVRIDDMKASTFKTMLHFIYTDELPCINDLVAPLGAEDSSMTALAGELLAAAHRFRLDRMRRLCENLLAKNITAGNALATLDLAGRHGCAELEGYCIEYISLPHVVKNVMKTLKFFQGSKGENKHPCTCNS
ncbi:unnamed protein product [Alopecurus aequalis]